MALLLSGCAPKAGEGPSREALPGLIASHNRRVDGLQHLAATGVIEYRWTDGDGRRHFEPQIDVRLWLDMPHKTALRGEKLGDTLFWIGSDDNRYWCFDLHEDPRRLIVANHGEPARDLPIGIAPLALVDLIGLTRLPAEGADAATYDPASRAWAIDARGSGGPVRLWLDSERLLPVRIAAISPEGDVILSSAVRRYEPVPIEGVANTEHPLLPTLVDIEDSAGRVAVKLALDRPSAQWTIVPARVFELPALVESLRPDLVEGDATVGATGESP
jgi:hypothetical protein